MYMFLICYIISLVHKHLQSCWFGLRKLKNINNYQVFEILMSSNKFTNLRNVKSKVSVFNMFCHYSLFPKKKIVTSLNFEVPITKSPKSDIVVTTNFVNFLTHTFIFS